MRRVCLGVLLAGAAPGCSIYTAPEPPAPPEVTTLALLPDESTTVQGTSTTLFVTLTRPIDNAGPADLSITGERNNITVTRLGIQTIDTRTTASFEIKVPLDASIGVYNLVVHGVGGGPELTKPFYLQVTPAPARFSMSLLLPALSIAPGSSGATTVSLTRVNYPAGITLSTENLPAGVSASFAPSGPIQGSSAVLTLTVAAGAALGTFSDVFVVGVGDPIFAQPPVRVPFVLTIAAGP